MRQTFMAIVQALLILCLLFPSAPALAQSDLGTRSIDELFTLLKEAPSEPRASEIAGEIWVRWTEPDDPKIAAEMAKILEKRREYDLRTAEELANDLIASNPDYAEGWNQRATLNYLTGNYPASLADIQATLKLEPRHFGALAGKVMILLKLGDSAGARRALIDALAIYPYLPERSLFPELGPAPTRT